MCFYFMLSALTDNDKYFVERIYLKYADYMYTIAFDVLKHRQDAEDTVNDAMCKIIKYLSKFEGNTDEETLNLVTVCIRSIVKNKAIDNYNKKKKRAKHIDDIYIRDENTDDYIITDMEAPDILPEDMVIRKEESEIVRKALLELTDDMQDAVNLVYMCGYSTVEAADYLGISDGAVRARLYKARNKLKKILSKELNLN